MPAVELHALLSESESRLCWCSRVRSRRLASAAGTGLPPEDDHRQPERDVLLADERVLARLEHTYRHAGPKSALHRRCALWLSAALENRLAAESGQGRAIRQVSAIVNSYRGTVGSERHGLDALRLILRQDPHRSRRRQAWSAMAELARSVEPLYRDTLLGLASRWSPRHGSGPVSFWQQPLGPFRMEWGEVDLPALADRFLRQTADLTDRFLHYAARVVRARSVRAHDLDFAAHELGRRHEQWFPPADAAASVGRGMRACGLPIDGLPIDPLLDPKWLPLSHAGWPPVDWAAFAAPGDAATDDVPPATRARIRPRVVAAADYRAGLQAGLVNLATATGAALSVLFGRAGFLAERSRPPGLDPAALIVADLLTEPNWLAGQTSMPRSEFPGFLTLGCRRAGLLLAMQVRMLAAMALRTWQAMSDLGGGWPDGGGELGRATGVEEAGRLLPLDFAVLNTPGYRVSLFLHEVAAAQVRRHLRREHGRIMGDRRTGECLVECFWRSGALVPLSAAVREATGQPLSEAALVAELREAIPA